MFEIPWQDYLFFFGNILFFIALLPSILSKNKPSFWTSLMTAVVLSSFSVTYISLDLLLSAGGSGLSALGWWILTIQKYRIDNNQTEI